MCSTLRKYALPTLLSTTLLVAPPVWSKEVAKEALDVVVMRPVGVAATAVGAALFVGTLPFTVVTGTWREPAYRLVYRPMKFTFKRPLGDY